MNSLHSVKQNITGSKKTVCYKLTKMLQIFSRNKELFFEYYGVIKYGQGDQNQRARKAL